MKLKLFLVAIVTLGFQMDAFAEWIQFRGAAGQSGSRHLQLRAREELREEGGAEGVGDQTPSEGGAAGAG